jgi:hypothetical protein
MARREWLSVQMPTVQVAGDKGLSRPERILLKLLRVRVSIRVREGRVCISQSIKERGSVNEQRTLAALKWRRTIERGHLIPVTFYRSQFVHLARVGYAKRADNEDLMLWSVRTFCETGRGYYGRAYFDDGAETTYSTDKCKRCWQRWRAKGEPAINQPPKLTVSEIYLPFGWRAVEPIGMEFDLGPNGDPSKTTDEAGKTWGEKRTELKRWQRGQCYVRIVELFDDDKHKYALRYGTVDEPKSDEWTLKSGAIEPCLKKASGLMGVGGTPS